MPLIVYNGAGADAGMADALPLYTHSLLFADESGGKCRTAFKSGSCLAVFLCLLVKYVTGMQD